MRSDRITNMTFFSVLQDILLSLLGSLLSVLAIRMLSEPAPGFIFLVLKWLGVAVVGTIAGILLSGCSKDIKRYATVRSIAKVVAAVIVKEAFMVLALLVGLVTMPSTPLSVLIILIDLIFTGAFLFYIRFSARLFSGSFSSVPVRASSKTALVVGTDNASIQMAQELEKEGYDVVGLLTTDKSMEGRVIHDYLVYHCADEKGLSDLQWRLGGFDGVFFPRRADKPISGMGGG